jgi:hypothetical protein
MAHAVEEGPGAVVFVCDRQGAALQRRERCLKLAGIPYSVHAEQRPSGTYFKLSVREPDAVAAHLALQMGGCARSSKLKNSRTSLSATISDMAQMFWDEVLLLWSRVTDLVRTSAPRLLRGPSSDAASR